MRRRSPGKAKIRLAELLEDILKIPVQAEDIRDAKGYWRTADVFRWEVDIPIPRSPCSLWMVSWEKISTLAKTGVILSFDPGDINPYVIYVSAVHEPGKITDAETLRKVNELLQVKARPTT